MKTQTISEKKAHNKLALENPEWHINKPDLEPLTYQKYEFWLMAKLLKQIKSHYRFTLSGVGCFFKKRNLKHIITLVTVFPPNLLPRFIRNSKVFSYIFTILLSAVSSLNAIFNVANMGVTIAFLNEENS